jgi:ketosteroid isomerase-like protein
MPRSTQCLLLLVLAFALLVPPVQAEGGDLTLGTGVQAHAGIDAIYAQFTRGYRELDPARVGGLYTEDALYLSPGDEIVQGRGNIEAGFADSMARAWDAGEQLYIRFEIVSRAIEGGLGYDVGYYHLTRTNKAGEARQSQGKFAVVIRCEKESGPCRFQVDSYSGVAPRATADEEAETPSEDAQEPAEPAEPADEDTEGEA